MMRPAPLCLLVVACICTTAVVAHAQDPPRPWIRSVRFDVVASTVTISGTGFADPSVVTLDGHLLTILPGASATQLVVVVPPMLLATPGTYRLTVVDPIRETGDAFEVAVSDL